MIKKDLKDDNNKINYKKNEFKSKWKNILFFLFIIIVLINLCLIWFFLLKDNKNEQKIKNQDNEINNYDEFMFNTFSELPDSGSVIVPRIKKLLENLKQTKKDEKQDKMTDQIFNKAMDYYQKKLSNPSHPNDDIFDQTNTRDVILIIEQFKKCCSKRDEFRKMIDDKLNNSHRPIVTEVSYSINKTPSFSPAATTTADAFTTCPIETQIQVFNQGRKYLNTFANILHIIMEYEKYQKNTNTASTVLEKKIREELHQQLLSFCTKDERKNITKLATQYLPRIFSNIITGNKES